MEQVRIAKSVFQQAEAFDDARPTPTAMLRGKYIDLQYVARLCAFNPDGAGERMDAGSVDAEILCSRHARVNLPPAGIDTRYLDFIAGDNSQPRFNGAIPDGMRRLGLESMEIRH